MLKNIAALCVVLLAVACKKENAVHEVTYTVTCPTCMIEMTNGDGNTEARNVAGSTIIDLERRSGDFVRVMARNDADSGFVDCKIYSDGDLFAHGQGTGFGIQVTASGYLP